MSNTGPSYRVNDDGTDCGWLDNRDDEPCYGQVRLVDEINEGGEWVYIHACDGHERCWRGQPYKPEEPNSTNQPIEETSAMGAKAPQPAPPGAKPPSPPPPPPPPRSANRPDPSVSLRQQDQFRIMYEALVKIAASPALFQETKNVKQIAADALLKLAPR